MYKRILAAVDGSRAASLALEEATKIAGAAGASILAVCVVEQTPQLVDVGAVYQDGEGASPGAVEVATAALSQAGELMHSLKVGGSTRAVDAYGESVATVLARVADEYEADLIAIGTHGRQGVKRLLLGSVAEALLRSSSVPVLVVRHDAQDDKAATRF